MKILPLLELIPSYEKKYHKNWDFETLKLLIKIYIVEEDTLLTLLT